MVVNLPPQYHEKEKELKEAKTPEEKITVLEEMLAIMPKHKSSEKLQALIKSKISKYKKMMEKSPSTAKKSIVPQIPKEGDAQVVICGPTNSGKSTLLASLTKAKPEIADYPFTTVVPIPGMLQYQDIKIQMIELPSLSLDFTDNWVGDFIRKSNLILFLFDLSSDDLIEEIEDAIGVLEKFKVKKEGEFQFFYKILWVGNKIDVPSHKEIKDVFVELYKDKIPYFFEISAKEKINIEKLPEIMFNHLEIIRVYTKIPGKSPDIENPYTIKKGSQLMHLAEIIHKDMVKSFKYARLWRGKTENPIVIGRDYILEDKDIVEIHF